VYIVGENRSIMQLVFIFLAFATVFYWFGFHYWQIFIADTYIDKVEKQLRDLFPHSNNEEYLQGLSLPVFNKIKT
jgi:hypothetical protein